MTIQDLIEEVARAICAQHRAYYPQTKWCVCDYEVGQRCNADLKYVEEGGYITAAKTAIAVLESHGFNIVSTERLP